MLDGSKGDCVVLGASRLDQLEQNLKLSKAPELNKEVVKFLDNWWRGTKHLCPVYFR